MMKKFSLRATYNLLVLAQVLSVALFACIFGFYRTPMVVAAALLTAVVPGLIRVELKGPACGIYVGLRGKSPYSIRVLNSLRWRLIAPKCCENCGHNLSVTFARGK